MENKTEESIIVTIDDTEGNSRDFVQDMVIPFDGKEFAVLVSIPESMDSEEEPDIILARIDKDQDGEVVTYLQLMKNMTLSLKSIMPCNYH